MKIISDFNPDTIKEVQEKYNAQYLLDTTVFNNNCQETQYFGMLFYQYDKPDPDYTNYFVLFEKDDGVAYISDGYPTFRCINTKGIQGFLHNNILYYSKHRHDYREVADTGVYIDGGLCYNRIIGSFNDEDSILGVTLGIEYDHFVFLGEKNKAEEGTKS